MTMTRRKKSLQRQRQRKYFRRIRDEILERLGGVCHFRGCGSRYGLQVDHVKGGGSKMRRRYTGSTYQRAILRGIKRGSNSYQLLCPTHNWLKRELNREHRSAK